MARSINQTSIKSASGPELVRADLTERRIRQISGWIILGLLLFAELGLAWDRNWHDILGRDQFFIPPHIMMYTGVGGTGLIALFIVLLDTGRYYQKKVGVDDSSTVRVLWLFHAPIGFFLLGFGTLTDLLAAPFDNYWHQLYGIDVTLWTPFHLMGVFGAIMASLGIIYIFASEVAHEREVGYRSRRFLGLNLSEWGIIVLLAGFQELDLPALTAFTPIPLGSVEFLTYPLIQVVLASFCLISVSLCIRKPGVALLTAFIVWPMSVLTEAYVPFAVRFMAARLDLIYRIGRRPFFNITLALIPLFTIICALLVEAVFYWRRRAGEKEFDGLRGAWLLGVIMAVPAVVVPPAIVYTIRVLAPSFPLQPDVLRVLQVTWLNMLISLPLAMVVGAIMAFVGVVFGDIWHWNKQ